VEKNYNNQGQTIITKTPIILEDKGAMIILSEVRRYLLIKLNKNNTKIEKDIKRREKEEK
jgi:hypothetical protein